MPKWRQDLLQGLIGPHQLSGLQFTIRIFLRVVLDGRPAEIVHPPDLLQVGPHHQQAADGLVDGHGDHGPGIQSRVGRVEGLGIGQTAPGGEMRPQDHRVSGDIPVFADQGFKDASSLDLVVVLTGNPVFGGYVGPGEQVLQDGLVIRRFLKNRFKESSFFRGLPFRFKNPLGEIAFQKIQVHVTAGLVLIKQMHLAGVGITADDRGFHIMFSGQGLEAVPRYPGFKPTVIRSWDSETQISH